MSTNFVESMRHGLKDFYFLRSILLMLSHTQVAHVDWRVKQLPRREMQEEQTKVET
jgi:hypothetical protein